MRDYKMRTIIVSVIGISSLFLVFIMQQNINRKSWAEEELFDSLTVAMNQTMTEMLEGDSYGITNQNEWMAAFLQSMICRLPYDVDLTVKVYQFDYELGQIDVEVIGRYRMGNGEEEVKSVHRKLVTKTKTTTTG